MQDLKIEYSAGRLVALTLDGHSILDNVQAISFKHSLEEAPIINITQAFKIAEPEAPETPRVVEGELVDAGGAPQPQPQPQPVQVQGAQNV